MNTKIPKSLDPLEFKLMQWLIQLINAMQIEKKTELITNHEAAPSCSRTFSRKILLNLLVSGGRDSMCLFNALAKVLRHKLFKQSILPKIQNTPELIVTHINHKKRDEESDQDERFVQDECLKRGIECFSYSLTQDFFKQNENENFQNAARIFRKKKAQEIAAKVCSEQNIPIFYVLTAHHAGDHAESVLLHLTRGSGASGLMGFAAVKDTLFKKPLAQISTQDIENYCNEKKVLYRTDSSNLNNDYSRNFVRHELIPKFKQLNPNFEQTLLRMSKNLWEYSKTHEFYSENQDFFVTKQTTGYEIYTYLEKTLNTQGKDLTQKIIDNILAEIKCILNSNITQKEIKLKGTNKIILKKTTHAQTLTLLPVQTHTLKKL